MALQWIPRAPKDKRLDFTIGDESLLGMEAPCTMYEKKPLLDPKGKPVEGLYVAWVTLNNPKAYNSYTLTMLKATAVAFDEASHDKSVVAVVLTGAGDRALCTGGNVPEYAEYFVGRPFDCHSYMTVYWHVFDAVWNSPKPFIRRANGLSIGGGEEISGCCDLTISSDLAAFGQVGPLHGSVAMGGACQFKSVVMTTEDAFWNAISCEQWSAYKMYRKNYIYKVVPVLKQDGKFIRNPLVITDKYVEDGDIVYGEFKTKERGYSEEEIKKAQELVNTLPRDLSLLDKASMDMAWTFANLYPGCVAQSLAMIRTQKRVAYDRDKSHIIWWWAQNALPGGEFDMGMTTFHTRKMTGKDNIDILKYRRLLAEGRPIDEELFEALMPKPKE